MHILTKALLLSLLFCQLLVPVAQARGVNKDQAVNTVKRKYPGKIIKITNASNHYQVRLLQKNGRVMNVKVDKKSGKILSKGRAKKGKGR